MPQLSTAMIDRGATVVQILPVENVTWQEGSFNYTTYLSIGTLGWCEEWRLPEHLVFHLANAFFLTSYLVPSTKYGVVFMHAALIVGFVLLCAWSWVVVCAADMFVWNLLYTVLNIFQLVLLLYKLRPVKFDPELEEAYHTLFLPFKVSRMQFKKLVCGQMAQIVSLHAGEAYALQNLTRTDRLGLLLSGKLNALSDQHFLHPILACEFLDSPEFESRVNIDDKFKVSIVAATSCRYLYWQRTSLEYLFAKETYLGTVMATLIARDIATKLYAMNNKIVTEKGFHLDIRLPCITSSLTAADKKSPTVKALRRHTAMLSAPDGTSSPDYGVRSREKLLKEKQVERAALPNGRLVEAIPLKEAQSEDHLQVQQMQQVSAADTECWLDTSSKYHSCEMVDE